MSFFISLTFENEIYFDSLRAKVTQNFVTTCRETATPENYLKHYLTPPAEKKERF